MNGNYVFELIKNSVDWNRFFRIRQSLTTEFNKPSERFLKSEVNERALCRCSNGVLSYINEPGRDCQILLDNSPELFLECKGDQSEWHLKNSHKFKLVNGNSKTKVYDTIPDTYAQYVMFFSLTRAYLIETRDLQRYIINDNSGNINVDVPIQKMKLLHEVNHPLETKAISFSPYLTEAFNNFYDNF